MVDEEKKEAPKLKVEVVEDSPEEVQETPGEEGAPEAKDEVKETPDKEEVPQETKKKFVISKRFLVIMLLVAGITSLIVGGVFRFRSSVGTISTPSPSPTILLPEKTPTPSPEEEISLSNYSLQVLNGSGVVGRAGEVATALEDAGFEGTDTGNAETYDYTDTEVQVKTGTPSAVFDAIKEALIDYTVVAGDELDEDSEFDVIVIVGEKD